MRDKKLKLKGAGGVVLALLLMNAALPPPARGQSGCVPPPTSLAAWWPFDEPSGTVATDVANAQNGTLIGSAVVPGVVGLARRFGPLALEAMIADGSGTLDLSGNQVSIEAWIKLENNPTTIQAFSGIVGKTTFPDRQSYLMVFESGSHIGLPQDRWLFEYVFTNAAGVRVHNQATGVVLTVDGQYHHVALTYDGAAVSLYVDGARRAVFPFSGNLKSVPSERVVISGNVSIDEVGIYGGSLSQDQIQAIFAAGGAGKCKPNQPPVANAGPDHTVIAGESLPLDGTGSADADGTIASFDWAFGDGGTANGAIVSHVYTTAGEFTATLTVTDDDGASDDDTAVVTVLAPSQAIQALSDLVASFNFQQGFTNSLDAKLQNARDALEAANAGDRQDAVNKLEAFINSVEAQRGKEITDAQADQLIVLARRILAVI